jgi:hypothetical protein
MQFVKCHYFVLKSHFLGFQSKQNVFYTKEVYIQIDKLGSCIKNYLIVSVLFPLLVRNKAGEICC